MRKKLWQTLTALELLCRTAGSPLQLTASPRPSGSLFLTGVQTAGVAPWRHTSDRPPRGGPTLQLPQETAPAWAARGPRREGGCRQNRRNVRTPRGGLRSLCPRVRTRPTHEPHFDAPQPGAAARQRSRGLSPRSRH